ncbi:MAG: DNA repair exonuclease [Limosilactobacillus sp.]|uniref:metallophosphoesterase family protein n=1 Tax=Limosilactobacillus sp. TaxID=2773925 RepID=UPI002701DF5B|nr:DNA repair exonuclease [Limosilactobacillus sp.]
MKFIHTADLHLGSSFKGIPDAGNNDFKEKLINSTFVALDKIVNDAIKEEVDFVLIVGDVFDGSDRLKSRIRMFKDPMEKLSEEGIPVVFCYGNHDHYDTSEDQDWAENIHQLDNSVETIHLTLKDGETVDVSGFSYKENHIPEDMVPQYPDRSDADWHIGMLHAAESTGSSNQTDDYAPFKKQELIDKKYDYWALGHIHKHGELNSEPPIVYAGNPQGRRKNEEGEHGYYLVTSENNRLVPEFKPVDTFRWVKLNIEITDGTEAEVQEAVEKQLDSKYDGTYLVDLDVKFPGKEIKDREILSNLQSKFFQQMESDKKEDSDKSKIKWYPYSLILSKLEDLSIDGDIDSQAFQQAREEVLNEEHIKKLVEDYFGSKDELKDADFDAEKIFNKANNIIRERGDLVED